MADGKYTKKDQQAINDAWSQVEYLASITDWTAGGMLRHALAVERKDRGSIHIAKALILGAIANQRPKLSRIADLYGVAPGCQLGYILGAHWRKREPWKSNQGEYRRMLQLVKVACAAHDASITRRLDQLKAK